jgi:hypothetical protein
MASLRPAYARHPAAVAVTSWARDPYTGGRRVIGPRSVHLGPVVTGRISSE